MQLAATVDWTRFQALCRRHRIQGVVWRAIGRFGLCPPDTVTHQLASDAVEIATDGLKSAGISSQILSDFTAAAIPVLFVKGLTLSKLAYGDPFVKMSHDIDILVPLNLVDRAGLALRDIGYRQLLPRHRDLQAWHRVNKESVWTRSGSPTVDLHSRLADNRRLIPGIGNHSPVRLVEIAPGITLPTLAPEELIAYLCVHGASSAWFRLKWIADLAALIASYEAPELARLVSNANRLGAGRAIPTALHLARDLFGIALCPTTERISATPANRRLAQISHRVLLNETEPTQRPFGTAAIHLSQFLIMPGATFKVSELVRQVRTFLARD